jgi:mRNA-degrading endonuclease RelE of RelBE toxin-antitoxin system
MDQWQVIIAPQAHDRMFEHFEFLARVSQNAAHKLLETLMEDLNALETEPFANPYYESSFVPRHKYRYRLSAKRYRIVFSIDENTIYVDDIQDCRQSDAANLL